MVIALLVDIVRSRELADRAQGQALAEATFRRVEDDISRHREVSSRTGGRAEEIGPPLQPLRSTVGDEFQGVYATLGDALARVLLIRLALPTDLDCRFGIGSGGIASVPSGDRDDLQDGSAWWSAREAIEAAHEREGTTAPATRTWFVPARDADGILVGISPLVNAYLSSATNWSPSSPPVLARASTVRSSGSGRSTSRTSSASASLPCPSVAHGCGGRPGRRMERASLREDDVALAGLVLIAVGLLDLVRDLVPIRWGSLRAGVTTALLAGVVAVACAVVALAFGYPPLAALVPPSRREPGGGCCRTVPPLPPSRSRGSRSPRDRGRRADRRPCTNGGPVLLDAYATTSFAVAVPAGGASLIAGVVLFLISPGNRIVRIALQGEADPSAAAASPASIVGGLKGGRLIGPLERILILGLFVAGAAAVIAALIAAKGIVRFPEISKDAEGGNRAEYFLVGSLVSWAVALAGVGALWMAALLPA